MKGILGESILHHVCIVTGDLEKAKKNFAELNGMEVPATEISNDYENMHTWFNGREAPRSGLSQCTFEMANGAAIEFIMPDEGPSAWKDYLSRYGGGLHHLAYLVKDLDTVVKRCEAKGMQKIQLGDFPGGHYAYVDGRSFIGTFLELMEIF